MSPFQKSSPHDFENDTASNVEYGATIATRNATTANPNKIQRAGPRLMSCGRAPLPASDYALSHKTGGKTKDGVGVLLGLTQVMTRNWLSEFNVSVDRFKGYLNDPYKLTSIIDSTGPGRLSARR